MSFHDSWLATSALWTLAERGVGLSITYTHQSGQERALTLGPNHGRLHPQDEAWLIYDALRETPEDGNLGLHYRYTAPTWNDALRLLTQHIDHFVLPYLGKEAPCPPSRPPTC